MLISDKFYATASYFFMSKKINPKALPLKSFFLILILPFAIPLNAQKIQKIYVHLYTDSLKKGTYNYINIDGKLDNGRYLPLDSTTIIFTASDGKFTGNDLFIPANFAKDSVTIEATLRSDTSICKKFTVYIKKLPDPPLQTEQELLNDIKKGKGRKKRGRR